MATITIDDDLKAKLAADAGDVLLIGPDGHRVGYVLSPETYDLLVRQAYDRAFARLDEPALRAAAADPKRFSTADLLAAVEGR